MSFLCYLVLVIVVNIVSSTTDPTSNPTLNPTPVPTEDDLMKFMTLLPTQCPHATYGWLTVYDEHKDVVWLMGGWGGSYQTTSFTFNYTSNVFTEQNGTGGIQFIRTSDLAHYYDGKIYFVEDNTYFIYSFDTGTQVLNTTFSAFPVNLINPCFGFNKNRLLFFVLNGQSSKVTLMYNLSSNTWNESLEDLNNFHLHGACNTYVNENNGYLYLYSFGGTSGSSIEKLNVDLNNGWLVLDDTTPTTNYARRSVNIGNGIIYLIGGYTGTFGIDEIMVFIAEKDIAYLSSATLQTSVAHTGAVFIPPEDRIYVFGGAIRGGPNIATSDIQYSNPLRPTSAPTLTPSVVTSSPTVFTVSPTPVPTSEDLIKFVTLSPTQAPHATYGWAAAYDSDNDNVWLFGGYGGGYQTTSYIYNVSSDSFLTGPNTGQRIFNRANNGVYFNGLIYLLDETFQKIFTFNPVTQVLNDSFTDYPISRTHFCLALSDTRGLLLLVNPLSQKTTLMFNITSNEWDESLLDIVNVHNYGSCNVYDNPNDGYLYLYSFGASANTIIEMLNVDLNDNWITLSDTTPSTSYARRSVNIGNGIIYLLGAYKTAGENVIYVFNAEKNIGYTSAVTLANPRGYLGAVYIPYLQQIYMFGGIISGSTGSKDLQITNVLAPTTSPSMTPSMTPTGNPTPTPTSYDYLKFTVLSPTTMPVVTHGHVCEYDPIKDVVWILSGYSSGYITTSYTFDYHNNNFTEQNGTSGTILFSETDFTFYYNGYIYAADINDNKIYQFSTGTQVLGELTSLPASLTTPCMTFYEAEELIFILNAVGSTVTYMYNMSSDVWDTGLSLLNSVHQDGSCQNFKNPNDNQLYLYSFGGRSGNTNVEKMNAYTNSAWSIIDNLNNAYYARRSINMNNGIIYLIGGYTGSVGVTDIVVFNAEIDLLYVSSAVLQSGISHTGAVYIPTIDRIYTFGGAVSRWEIQYTNKLTDTNSPTLNPTQPPTLNPTPFPTFEDRLSSVTLDPATIPVGTYGWDAAYDPIKDEIWFMGGYTGSVFVQTSYTFNLDTKVTTQQNGTDGLQIRNEADMMHYYNGNIYLVDDNSNVIYRFHIGTQIITVYATFPGTYLNACFAFNEIDLLFFILGSSAHTNVMSYNITSDTWDQSLPNLNVIHSYGVCNTFNNPNDGQLYLYSFGGTGTTNIERMNVYTNSAWTVVNNMDTTNGYRKSVNIGDGIIYIIGGWTGSAGSTRILVFNAEGNNLYISSATLPTAVGFAACVYARHKIYIFGGAIAPSTSTNKIQITNAIVETIAPTMNPTITPTANTGSPSQTPTEYPTLFPSKNPTSFPSNNPSQTPTLNPTLVPTARDFLKFTALNPTSFPIPTYGWMVTYDSDNDIIWLFGGYTQNIGGYPTTSYTFDYHTNTVTQKNDTGLQLFTSSEGSFYYSNTIYFADENDGVIYQFDTNTQNISIFKSYPAPLSDPCMTFNEDYKLIFLFGPLTTVYAYNFTSDSWDLGINNMNGNHQFASCNTFSNPNDDGLYLYAFGGTGSSTVETLNYFSGGSWSIIYSSLNTATTSRRSINVGDGYIYLIGGWNGTPRNVIFVLNGETNDFYLSGATLATPAGYLGAVYIPSESKIYIFGGAIAASTGTSDIRTTNALRITDSPTMVPTINPTSNTANPSDTPTNYPTLFPSINPTSFPSSNPSQTPTLNPTPYPTGRDFLKFTTLLPSTMPVPVYSHSATYDPVNDVVWIMGGTSQIGGFQTTSFTFDYHTETFTEENGTNGQVLFTLGEGSFFYDGRIFLSDLDDNKIYQFDTNNQNISSFRNFPQALTDPCMTFNEAYKLIFLLGGLNTVFAYNFTSDTWDLSLSLMNYNHLYGSCSTFRNPNSNDELFVYAFAGQNNIYNEKMNYDTRSTWSVIYDSMEFATYGSRTINLGNGIIYIIGGYNGGGVEDIFVFNAENDNTYLSSAALVTPAGHIGAVFIPSENRFYLFAGANAPGTGVTDISVSNPLAPTTSPTKNPTITPTLVTSNPTPSPTAEDHLKFIALIPATCPLPTYGWHVVYDENNDIVWLFGGYSQSAGYQTASLSFDYHTNTFTQQNNTGITFYTSGEGSFWYNDRIYMTGRDDRTIKEFNPNNQNIVSLTSFPAGAVGDASMTFSPEYELMFLVGETNTIFSYNFSSDSWDESLSNMNGNHRWGGCSTYYNPNYDELFVYAFGGSGSTTIEKLDYDDTATWTIVYSGLNSPLYSAQSINIGDGIIYIIGGWNGGTVDDIFVFNAENDNTYLSSVSLVTPAGHIGAVLIPTENKYYLFGGAIAGSTGTTAISATNALNPTMSPSMTPTSTPTIVTTNPTPVPTERDYLKTISILSESLPVATYGIATEYDPINDVVWLLSGYSNIGGYKTTSYTFNYYNNSFTQQNGTGGTILYSGGQNTFYYTGKIYVTDIDDQNIYQFDTTTQNLTNYANFPVALADPCLTFSIDYELIFLIGPTNTIYSYNMSSQTWDSSLPTLNGNHKWSACNVFNNPNDNEIYIYSFAGESSTTIEKMNYDTLSGWDIIYSSLGEFAAYGIESVNIGDGFIYLIGGWNVNGRNWIYVLNAENDNIYLSSVTLLTAVGLVGSVYIPNEDRIYIFGGSISGSVATDDIQITNVFHPTMSPSMSPTPSPTIDYCYLTIDRRISLYTDWKLVRRVKAGTAWHPATDNLMGTDVYCDSNDTFICNGSDPSADNTFSIAYNISNVYQFLFTEGDCTHWLIATPQEVNNGNTPYETASRTIDKSSFTNGSYSAVWLFRALAPEDPWISPEDHTPSVNNDNILYGENGINFASHSENIAAHNGGNVFVRYLAPLSDAPTVNTNNPSENPTSNPTQFPSVNPTNFPTSFPTNNPTMTPTSNFCYLTIDRDTNVYTDWKLVRRVKAGISWHPATDDLLGTDVYCDSADPLICNGSDPSADNTFSIAYNVNSVHHFLFTEGNCTNYVIATPEQVTNYGTYYGITDRTIFKSSISNVSYLAEWYYRSGVFPEDPWITVEDRSISVPKDQVMYAENSFVLADHSVNIQNYNGGNVFIRELLPTTSPTAMPSLNPSSQPSISPSLNPSNVPTNNPTEFPSTNPTQYPSEFPSVNPTNYPSQTPSNNPTDFPSVHPTEFPSDFPSGNPTQFPSTMPSNFPTNFPSVHPTQYPTGFPSSNPTQFPSFYPSNFPTSFPSTNPTNFPTNFPTFYPSKYPSYTPTIPSVSPTQATVFNLKYRLTTNATALELYHRRFSLIFLLDESFEEISNYTRTSDFIITIVAIGNISVNDTSSQFVPRRLENRHLLNDDTNNILIDTEVSCSIDSTCEDLETEVIDTQEYVNENINDVLSGFDSIIIILTDPPTKYPSTQPTMTPTRTDIDGLVVSYSNNLNPDHRFNPTDRLTFSVSGEYSNDLVSSGNVSTQIIWYCNGCDPEYAILTENSDDVQIYEEIEISNETDTVSIYSLLTLNSEFIQLCLDSIIFSDGNTYDIGVNVSLYLNNNLVSEHSKITRIHSNTKAIISPKICNIYPKSGESLSTVFTLYCNETLVPNNAQYFFNFFYNGIGINEFEYISNTSNNSMTTILGAGTHTITAVIIDENEYFQCFGIDNIIVSINVTDTEEFLGLINDFVDDLNYNSTNELLTDSIAVIDTLITFSNGTNLSVSEIDNLVEIQESLIDNLVNTTNQSLDELISVSNSLSSLTTPIVDNKVVNVTDQIISGNITVETDTDNLINVTIGELELYLLNALVATTDYKQEDLTVTVINIREFLNLSYIIYYVEYSGEINSNINATNVTIIVDTIDLSIEIDTDLLLDELQTSQPLVFTTTSRLSEEGFAILSSINSASYYSSAYAVAISNIVINLVDDLTNSLLEHGESLDSSTAQSLLTAIENLVSIRGSLGDNDEFGAKSGDNTVTLLTTVGQLLLLNGQVGEEIVVSTPKITLGAARFDRHNPNCPDSASKIQLSDEYVDIVSSNNSDSNMDCVVAKAADNAYDPSNSYNQDWTGFFVNLDVNLPISKNRRRLPEYEESASSYLDRCNPILITIENQHITGWNETYPKCLFWNTTTEIYEDNGCYVLTKNENNSICACLHATYFGVSGDDFAVQANPVTLSAFTNFTWNGFKKHPAGILVSGLVIIVCISMMYIIPGKDDKPLLAHDKSIHKNYIESEDIGLYYRVIADRRILDDPNMKLVKKMYGLWLNTMKNEHEIISLFFRHKGTGFTGKQRIAMLLMKLMTILAVNGIFYGNEQSSAYGDIMVSVYGTLLSMPPGILKTIFLKYHIKERISKSADSGENSAENSEENDKKQLEMVVLKSNSVKQTDGMLIEGEGQIEGDRITKRESQSVTVDEQFINELMDEEMNDENEVVNEYLKDNDFVNNIQKEELKNGTSIKLTDDLEENNNEASENENENENKTKYSELELKDLFKALSTNTSPVGGETDKQEETDNENKEENNKEDSFDDILMFALGKRKRMTITSGKINDRENIESKEIDTKNTPKKKLTYEERKELLDELRKKVLKKNRICPYWFKYIAWTIIVVWTLGCSFLALYWAIRFDQVLNTRNESYQSQCDNGMDMSELDWLNYNKTLLNLTSWLSNTDPAVFEPPKDDSFGDNITSTDRWLLSIFTSYAMSVFITGPIITFVMQLKRILTYKKDEINESYYFSLYNHFI